ncbi:MAG TPA: TonB-dependent receptor plug domain-containing protein, partial [Gemmatimonadaceae bacterium]|nr:TonB-dependent receptor plug domain-containing protein [Gemmatimonadaceae bacterium]
MRHASRPGACVARTTHGIALLVLTLSASRLHAQERPAPPGDSARKLEAVTVTAIRAGGLAPISAKTITRERIEPRYFGQDIPLVLQSAPSLTSYSETGTYWGYSYMRLRGIDQSRINLTLDGIPLNDPEDQVLYFADFPDLANSLHSVQIQRGTGTSSNGTAAYAGSINFETLPIASLARGGEVQVGGGSFGAKRASIEYQTGLLPSRFAFYGRLSGYQVEGYRYHSGMEGRSGFFSGGWFGDRDIVKVIATAGLFADTMAYLAVPESELATDRRINPLRPDELDRFGEQLVAAAYT